MTVDIRVLSPGEYSLLVPTLVDIYIEAMEYDPSIRDQRLRVWRGEVSWPGFTSVVAVEGDAVLGVAYGFIGARNRWWDKQLIRAMRENGGLTEEHQQILTSYFEVAEIHVRPQAQGHGIGARMLAKLLSHAPANWALLSTPEVDFEANSAFTLYRRFGFEDIARNYLYPGDSRPFALLGRKLPLTP